MSDTPTYVITLVHGTFARNAQWINEGSSLRATLEKTLPGPLLIVPFRWSGRNSLAARHTASEQLGAVITKQLALYPEAEHYVIAHSHGGNIIMYALQDTELERQIDGVVCLSTPFLHVKKRNLGGGHGEAIVRSLLMVFVIGLILLIGEASSFVTTDQNSYPSLILLLCLLVLPVCLARLLYPYIERRASALIEQMKLAPIGKDKLLIIRTTGDEATLGLGVSQLLSLLTGKWTQLVVRLRQLVETMPFAWLLDLLIAFPALLGLPAILLAVLTFGPRLGLYSMLVEINSEAVPPGSWSVHHLYPKIKFGEDSVRILQLSHSSAYQDDQALDLIQRWIMADKEYQSMSKLVS